MYQLTELPHKAHSMKVETRAQGSFNNLPKVSEKIGGKKKKKKALNFRSAGSRVLVLFITLCCLVSPTGLSATLTLPSHLPSLFFFWNSQSLPHLKLSLLCSQHLGQTCLIYLTIYPCLSIVIQSFNSMPTVLFYFLLPALSPSYYSLQSHSYSCPSVHQ